jgi:23S rRNA (cytosine1962-C5)-methyltransferase
VGARRVLTLRRPLLRAIERGHPWIYDQALGDIDAAAGEVVTIAEGKRGIATAFADPRGPIRARVLALGAEADVGPAWVRERARIAAAQRSPALSPELEHTDALRVIHGENDGLPGLTVDVYAGVAVIVYDGEAAAKFWRPRVDAALDGIRAGGVAVAQRWFRPVRGSHHREGHGDDVPPLVTIREHGATFRVDVRAGQKTGFFLDMRANRARVAALARGARVLNLCAYSGGFSVLAGLGGAAHVTSVDLAAPAVAAAEQHWAANGLPSAAHTGVTADAFAFLEQAAGRGERWDVVIADPPSFAASESARPRALAAYQRLNRLSLAVTAPGGVLVSASCSSHITEADLRTAVAAAAEQRVLRVIAAHGAAADHPTIPGFPEGRYLKVLICVT